MTCAEHVRTIAALENEVIRLRRELAHVRREKRDWSKEEGDTAQIESKATAFEVFITMAMARGFDNPAQIFDEYDSLAGSLAGVDNKR